MAEPDKSQATTRNTRFACCINNSTDTHSEYPNVTDLTWEKQLHEIAPMLRLYAYCVCSSPLG